jgi:hypothetical protein
MPSDNDGQEEERQENKEDDNNNILAKEFESWECFEYALACLIFKQQKMISKLIELSKADQTAMI